MAEVLAVLPASTVAAASHNLWCRGQGSDAAVRRVYAGQADLQPDSGVHGQSQQESQQEQQQKHQAAHANAAWQRHRDAASASHGAFSSASQHEERWEQDEPGSRADNTAYSTQRAELLAAALRHVPACGWAGGSAAAAAAAELGLSPAAAGMLGSDSEFVQLFVADCNRRLEAELADMQAELARLDVRWV